MIEYGRTFCPTASRRPIADIRNQPVPAASSFWLHCRVPGPHLRFWIALQFSVRRSIPEPQSGPRDSAGVPFSSDVSTFGRRCESPCRYSVYRYPLFRLSKRSGSRLPPVVQPAVRSLPGSACNPEFQMPL